MKKNTKTANGMKRSKLSITLYVFAALSALYFIYSVVSTWSYLGTYYASAGLSVTDDLSTALGYVITGSFNFLLTTVMLFGIAVIYDELCKLNGAKFSKTETVCECEEKAEKVEEKTAEAEEVASETAEEALNKLEEAAENEEAAETEVASEDEENAEEK